MQATAEEIQAMRARLQARQEQRRFEADVDQVIEIVQRRRHPEDYQLQPVNPTKPPRRSRTRSVGRAIGRALGHVADLILLPFNLIAYAIRRMAAFDWALVGIVGLVFYLSTCII